MIPLQCVCGRKIAAPDKWLGKRVKCPQCGKPVLVAVADDAAIEPPVPASAPAPASEPPATSPSAPSPVVPTNFPAAESETPAVASSAIIPEETRSTEPPQPAPDAGSSEPSRPSKPLLAPRSSEPMQMAPKEEKDEDYSLKLGCLPRVLGALGILVAIGAGVSCWFPPLDAWTAYIALGGVAISTLGFGLSMSRYRAGLLLPVIGLVLSLAAIGLPVVLQKVPKIAPRQYLQKADEARRQHEQAAEESQRRGILSVESIHLADNKDPLAAEVSYKLINRSGKAIKLIEGSLQFTDREHRSLGGLALNLAGPIAPSGAVEGKNTWTMEDALRQAISENKFTAEYRAQTVVYSDGTIKTYSRP